MRAEAWILSPGMFFFSYQPFLLIDCHHISAPNYKNSRARDASDASQALVIFFWTINTIEFLPIDCHYAITAPYDKKGSARDTSDMTWGRVFFLNALLTWYIEHMTTITTVMRPKRDHLTCHHHLTTQLPQQQSLRCVRHVSFQVRFFFLILFLLTFTFRLHCVYGHHQHHLSN